DVLLSGLEGHAECPVSIDVSGQAYDAAGHPADVLLSAREDPEEGTAEIHRRAKGLALPDHDVRSEIAGRSHDRLGDRIHAHDEDALRGGPDLLELLLEETEEVRVLRANPAHVGGDGLAQLRQIEHPRLAVVLHLAN